MNVRQVAPSDRLLVSTLLDESAVIDGEPPLSEHKATRVGTGDVCEVMVEAGGIAVGYGQAAHHRYGNGSPGGHWAMEFVVYSGERAGAVHDALFVAVLAAIPDADPVTAWATDRGAGLATLAAYERAGWKEVRSLHRLERELPVADAPHWAEGIELRSFVLGKDEETWLRVNNRTFAGHPENGALGMDDLLVRFEQPWFDAEGFLVVWDRGEMAGFCWTKRHPQSVGEIYIIGVDPAWQGRGMGNGLVLAGLAYLHDVTGAEKGMLYVDATNVDGLRLYGKLGFAMVLTNREYGPGDNPVLWDKAVP